MQEESEVTVCETDTNRVTAVPFLQWWLTRSRAFGHLSRRFTSARLEFFRLPLNLCTRNERDRFTTFHLSRGDRLLCRVLQVQIPDH